MNLDHLRYFEALARLEHYGKAAEKLHISQPNLTYAIAQLEQEIGVPLFEKVGRSIRLTRYGHEFLRTVQTALDVLDTGTRAVQEIGEMGGHILLGSIRTLGTMLVPTLMRDFQAEMQGRLYFELHTESGFSAHLLKGLEEGRLDFCFTSSRGDPALFESLTFQRPSFVVITPKGHPLAEKKEISLRDTLTYPQICFASCSGLRKSIDGLFEEINAAPTIAMETEEDDVVAGLVAAGFGIAVLPDDPLLRSLPLEILHFTEPDPVRIAYLSRRRNVPLPKAAEDFWMFCRNHLQQDIRHARMVDIDAIAAVEAECFPVAEAATREEFAERIRYYGEHFWLLYEGDKLISFVDGFVTDEADLTDEMYERAEMHDEHGAWQMIFGVNTLPDYRARGYAGRLLRRAIEDARQQGRKGLVLTCKDRLVHYYASFGFVDEGISASTHGNVEWHQMRLTFPEV